MPQLTWLGDAEAKRAARRVPYRLLDTESVHGDPGADNWLIQGDNLDALEPPPPTPLEVLAGDPQYQDGAWLLAEIDVSRLRPKAVRLNISLPESLARRIDAHAKSHHMSRSAFLAQAASEAMRRAE